MFKIRCIIVEDEPLASRVLCDYISEVPFLKLEGTFKDAILAMEYLRTNTVDLIFLDIHLPKLKGMSFLRTIKDPPSVIVTTAYHQYAVEAFDLNVTDYLLKPFDFERFLVAVNKIRSAGKMPGSNSPVADAKDSIFINVHKKKVKVLFTDIVYVESQREYVRIVTTRGEFLTKMGTQDFESMLPPLLFRRIHRSYIISMKKIDSYTSEMVEVNGVSIPIGRGYRNVIENI
jgi:two-component system, LytTR family, response regulator